MAQTILEQKQRLSAIHAELKTLSAAAKLTGGKFTAEQREKVKTLQAEAETLKAAIDEAEADEAIHASVEELGTHLAEVPERRSAPDALGGRITHQQEAWESDPKKGFKSHREFLMAVMRHGQGERLDPRLKPLQQLAAGSDEARGISDPAGGFLLPEAFSPNLLQIDPEADPMAGAGITSVPMTASVVRMPARVDKNHSSSVSGGLTVTRRPETVAATASQMTFERVSLDAHALFGLSYATEEILTDSPISFVALLQSGFSDQFTSHLVNERLNGTGVGEFLGIMTALDSSSLGPTLSISKESGQAANTIVYANIIKMRSQCWGYGRAVWLANHDTLPQLMLLNQSVGTGGIPVWQPSASEDHPDMLLGRPLIFTEYAKTLGTTGDIVLGNWSQYLEGIYQPLQSAESMHVRFVNHERAFKFWLRNAGAPWWKSALTPKNSTNKLSPFVILATRS